jgi:hypothetical protein
LAQLKTLGGKMTTIVTVKQFAERQPAFTNDSLRSLIFNGDKNGLNASGAIQRIGRRILIIEERFIAWVEGGVK